MFVVHDYIFDGQIKRLFFRQKTDAIYYSQHNSNMIQYFRNYYNTYCNMKTNGYKI